MTEQIEIYIPEENVNIAALLDFGVIHLRSAPDARPPKIKCPKCGIGVRWTSDRSQAEFCLCSVKWIAVKGAKGGLILNGAKSAVEKICDVLSNLG